MPILPRSMGPHARRAGMRTELLSVCAAAHEMTIRACPPCFARWAWRGLCFGARWSIAAAIRMDVRVSPRYDGSQPVGMLQVEAPCRAQVFQHRSLRAREGRRACGRLCVVPELAGPSPPLTPPVPEPFGEDAAGRSGRSVCTTLRLRCRVWLSLLPHVRFHHLRVALRSLNRVRADGTLPHAGTSRCR